MSDRIWMFRQMGLAHRHIGVVKGQQFYKLLGTGKGEGFSFFPDFGTYALLQVWDSLEAFKHFLSTNVFCQNRRRRSDSETIYVLQCVGSRGTWDEINPFRPVAKLGGRPIAVITRARIRTRRLIDFWRFVPKSSSGIAEIKGLIFSKGIGETPWVNMATFSVWENLNSMQNFSLRTDGHRQAVRKTKELNWYSEELFARFEVLEQFSQVS